MAEFVFERIVLTKKFYIVKGAANPGDAFLIHKDTHQNGLSDTRSIGFCTYGKAIVVYNSNPPTTEEFTRGKRSPRYIEVPSHTLTCVEKGDYFCVTPTSKSIIEGDTQTLEVGNIYDTTGQYLFVVDGIVSVAGQDREGPKLLKLSSTKQLTCVVNSVIVDFNVLDDTA